MMYLIVVCALFSISYAAVLPEESQARITNYRNTNDGIGNYIFSFSTSNGIHREEIGSLVNADENNDIHNIVEGSYSYTDPDGKVVHVRYTADQNGYRILNPDLGPSISAVPPNVVASLLGK